MRCGESKVWWLRSGRGQCAGCGHQVSVTAGTIFQGTRTPLTIWFRAMWWMTSQKNGISALGLQRVLGLGSYQTAWVCLHKLRRAMVRPGRERLWGSVEVDETYLGGLEEGMRGRQRENQALIVVAAEKDGKGIGRIRMRRDFRCFGLQPGVVRERIGETRQRSPHRRMVGLRTARGAWLPSPCHSPAPAAEIPFGAVAARTSGGVPVKAMAAGHASGGSEHRASGRLSGRVHLPVQPAQVAQPREAVLPSRPASSPCTTSNLQGNCPVRRDGSNLKTTIDCGYLSELDTHLPE